MQLTRENYYSSEANWAYMSSTQFKAFDRCEAAALAELRGDYAQEPTVSMLVGSYVDAYFEGTLDGFQDQHPELFRKDGELKAQYFPQAEKIIHRLERDDLFMLLMSGEKQVIRTGEIAGVPFKIRIDSLLSPETTQRILSRFPETRPALGFGDGAIVDGKVMRDVLPVWNGEEHSRVPFVEAWGYDFQGAIYQAVEGHMIPFILAVGTKESEPDLAALYISDADLAARLAEVEDRAPRYHAIKQGVIAPEACGKCPYCRSVKRLTRIVDYRDI